MTDYNAYAAKVARKDDIDTARVRGWGYFLGAYLTGPIWPAVIACRTNKWSPFFGGLALGVASLPFAALDLGIITSVPAAALGTAMMSSKSASAKARLDITSPEEADLLRFKDLGI